jgi:hypothetical protein
MKKKRQSIRQTNTIAPTTGGASANSAWLDRSIII